MVYEEISDEKLMESDDLLDEAYGEDNLDKRKKLLKKSLELNPYNYDAKAAMIQMLEDPFMKLKEFRFLIDEAEEYLDEVLNIRLDDEKYVGGFYGILETRPYMRIRLQHMMVLRELGYLSEATTECLFILYLNENDNMGVRYIMQNINVSAGNIELAKHLREQFDEFSFRWDFPYALLLFIVGEQEEAEEVMLELFKHYEDVKEILVGQLENAGEEYYRNIDMDSARNEEVLDVIVQLYGEISIEFLEWVKTIG